MEGGDSTQISVNLNRIEAGRDTVTVTIELEGSGLSVSPSSLTFSATKLQTTVTITAINDSIYTGDREVTVTFAADDYVSARVTVTIEEDEAAQQQINLSVIPPALEIVTGRSTPISITVSTTARITITSNPEGIAEASTTSFSWGNTESTQISVRGDRSGTTTLTITAEAAGYTSATTSVSVEVAPEPLRIAATPVRVSLVEMEGGDSTQISVNLNRIEAGRDTVTVTIELEGSGLSVSPSSLTFSATKLQTTVTITAINDSIYTGDREVTVTFAADDYVSARVTVTIEEDEAAQQQINLSVIPPALEIVTGESAPISITVSTTATITITSNPEGIAEASTTSFSWGNTESTQISVRGDRSGTTTLTITAEAAGYTSATTSVSVEVAPEPLRIAATPVRVSLVEMEGGDSTQISVNLNRIEAGRDTVTVTIELEGNGLRVSPSSLTFSATKLQTTVTITAINDSIYTGDREVTVTLIADDYASATVTVTIEEDEAAQQQINLNVIPPALEIVTGRSTPISITVSTTARITITSDPEGIAEAPASFGLNENGSTQIDVFGDRSGATTLTITADAVGYVSATTSVSVVVQDPLSIEVMPDMLRLVEDVGSTDISVSLNRIESDREDVTVTVTINPPTGSGLRVSPSSLTFSATKLQTTVTVTAINDSIYTGDREVTVTFEADDYASARVTVTIEEDEAAQQQINLSVIPPALEIVTGESAPISITVSTTARITITSNPEGIAEASTTSFSWGNTESTQISVRGDRSGTTTLTITAEAAGYTSATTSVSVEVAPEPLRIAATPVSVSLVEMEGGDSTEISVNLNRIESDREDVTVTVTINPPTGSGLRVSPSSLTFSATKLQTTVTVTAINDSIYTGDREVTVTFEADDYASARVTVTIEEDEAAQQQINLSVIPPALEIVTGESAPISITVSTTARITITSNPEGIAEASTTSFSWGNTESTQISVRGDRSGTTTLTITAEAAGYTSATTSVSVEVAPEPLRIAATPVSVSLMEMEGGDSTQISVNLNRIEAGRDTVTVTIELEGNGLRVSPSSLTFSATKLQTTVTITAINDSIYTGDREVTVTLIADDYASATVTVTIEEDEAAQQQINLNVIPPALEIVTGASTPISITVSTTARITITSNPEGIAEASTTSFSWGNTESTQISVRGDRSGTTTLTITAEAAGYTSATTSVSVEVAPEPLRIAATPVRVSLVEMEGGDSTEISVNLNRIEAGRDTVKVTIELEGSGLRVSPSSLTFSATKLQTTVTVTAINDSIYTGDREVTVTFEADDYASARVTVEITDDDPQPIELAVAPTALNLVRFTTSTEIEVSVAVDAELDIETMGAVSLTNGRNLAELNLSAGTTRIAIVGVSEGMGTVTVTASGAGDGTGAMQETQTVSVTVSTPTLMISTGGVNELNIATNQTTAVMVTVSSAGDPTDVTLTATVTGIGIANVASVTPTEIIVSANTPRMFTVEGLAAGNTTLILTASHRDYISTITEVAVSVYLPPVGLSASTELEITVGTTEALTIQVNAVGAARTTLTTSIEISTIISVTAPATPESLTGGNTIINVTGDNQGETDLVIRVEADGYEAAEITVKVRVIPVPALRFRIKVFLEGAQ